MLVNNAGFAASARVQDTSDALWDETLRVNLSGVFHCTRAALESLLQFPFARVVNVASTAGLIGYPHVAAYCAAKHGVIGFTRALSLELVKRKITVNAIAPGWVETDMAALGMTQGATYAKVTFDEFKKQMLDDVPIKRMIDPAEVAALVTFLCSKEASAITGQTYNICGGKVMS